MPARASYPDGDPCLTLKTVVGYDAMNDFIMISILKEGADVAGDALKVEDSSWDAEVMKASELVMVDFGLCGAVLAKWWLPSSMSWQKNMPGS